MVFMQGRIFAAIQWPMNTRNIRQQVHSLRERQNVRYNTCVCGRGQSTSKGLLPGRIGEPDVCHLCLDGDL